MFVALPPMSAKQLVVVVGQSKSQTSPKMSIVRAQSNLSMSPKILVMGTQWISLAVVAQEKQAQIVSYALKTVMWKMWLFHDISTLLASFDGSMWRHHLHWCHHFHLKISVKKKRKIKIYVSNDKKQNIKTRTTKENIEQVQ